MSASMNTEQQFSANYYHEGMMWVNHYTLAWSMVSANTDQMDQNIALDRIRYYITEVLNGSAFCNWEESEQIQNLLNASFKVVELPSVCFDQIILIALWHKFNAIVQPNMVIPDMSIKSSNGDNVEFTYSHESEPMEMFDQDTAWWLSDKLTWSSTNKIKKQGKIIALQKELDWKDVGLGWDTKEISDNPGRVVLMPKKKDDKEK
tara:strand:- start:612 stop:1226 length:615 start_codon:yes stop_codon:yes gene_type:complete